MAHKASIKGSKLGEVLGAGRRAEGERTREVGVSLVVSAEADRHLVEALRDAFVPALPHARVDVRLLEERAAPDPTADVCLVVPDARGDLAQACAVRSARMGIPCAVLVDSSLEVHDLGPASGSDVALGYLVASDPQAALAGLAQWLVKALGPLSLTLAANFPFVRPAKVRSLIDACAAQNAVIGAIEIIPGADLPAMTMNQAKLAVQIAAACGVELRLEGLADLAGVLGAGFAYRALARQLVGAIPGVGWALKGTVGYLGTQATGTALALRYGQVPQGATVPGDLDDLMASVRQAAGGVSHLAFLVADLVGEGASASGPMTSRPGAKAQAGGTGAGPAPAQGDGYAWIGGPAHEG